MNECGVRWHLLPTAFSLSLSPLVLLVSSLGVVRVHVSSCFFSHLVPTPLPLCFSGFYANSATTVRLRTRKRVERSCIGGVWPCSCVPPSVQARAPLVFETSCLLLPRLLTSHRMCLFAGCYARSVSRRFWIIVCSAGERAVGNKCRQPDNTHCYLLTSVTHPSFQ